MFERGLAVAIGIASGVTAIALGIAAGPLVSLLLAPAVVAIAVRGRASIEPEAPAEAEPERRGSEGPEFTLAHGGGFAAAVLLIVLYHFLEIIRSANRRGLPIRGVLAGPIVHAADRHFVHGLKEELGARLDYRGPVYGAEKVQFFRDIDVFVFPTSYENEAQPMVLFEAMAQGIPVLSCDRGCIRSQVAEGGEVFRQEVDIEFIRKDHHLTRTQVVMLKPNPGQAFGPMRVVIFGHQFGACPDPADLMEPAAHGFCGHLDPMLGL